VHAAMRFKAVDEKICRQREVSLRNGAGFAIIL
jgi:hypothetical protein